MDLSVSKENVYQLLSALRLQNPTQYYTLIKMHLSFATDNATDQCDGSFDNSGMITSHRWNLSAIVRFMRGTNSSLPEANKLLLTVDVVHQVFELIRFLNKDENIIQEGLFRKTGSVTRQAELKTALQTGKNLNLDSKVYSPHDCASVLKSFLADLPDPLLQDQRYHVHCQIAEMCGHNNAFPEDLCMYTRQVRAIRLVFLLLPSLNYEILRELLFFLKRVASFQEVNKMSALNLGTMFAPHILCPRKIAPNDLQHLSQSLSYAIAFLIENATDLFQIPTELGIDVMEYFRTAQMETSHSSTPNPQEMAATKTSLSFVDRKLTTEAMGQDMTEVALAELYAYVQSLPDSTKKRKLITQFNKVNGQGTPKYDRQNTQIHTHKKTEFKIKSFGDSIKKHLFSRGVKKIKPQRQLKKILTIKRSNSHEIYSGLTMTPRSRCPIIIGSSSSLSSISTHSEHLSYRKTTNELGQCSNPAKAFESLDEIDYSCLTSHVEGAIGTSPEKNIETPIIDHNSPVSRLRSNSLFEGFFKHLSTSSLIKLVSKLSSNASPPNEPRCSPPESSHSSTKDESYHDESLSSLFKDYLLSRNILTDNPLDVSSDYLSPNESPILESNFYSGVSSSNNSFRCHPSTELEKTLPKLSCSLIFCLDGNNPLDYELNPSVKRQSYPLDDCTRSQLHLENTKLSDSQLITTGQNLLAERICAKEKCSRSAIFEEVNKYELNFCSSHGRRTSLRKKRNGVPMLQKEERVETLESLENSTQIFETDL